MIELLYVQEAMQDMPEYPETTMSITIDDTDMAWPDLMKIFANQLPRFGYIMDTEILLDAIDDASQQHKDKIGGLCCE